MGLEYHKVKQKLIVTNPISCIVVNNAIFSSKMQGGFNVTGRTMYSPVFSFSNYKDTLQQDIINSVVIVPFEVFSQYHTLSDSHSRVHVLMASTHRLGFMSLGQIPACELMT